MPREDRLSEGSHGRDAGRSPRCPIWPTSTSSGWSSAPTPAALCPGPGLWMRASPSARSASSARRARLTLPVLMLAVLLFNAGLGAQARARPGLAAEPGRLAAPAWRANLRSRSPSSSLVSQAMRAWHNPDEVQQILVGLALVAVDADRRLLDGLVAERRRRPGPEPGAGPAARRCSAR